MALVIECYMCGEELDQPGGLLFSPPGSEVEGMGKVVAKTHFCHLCYTTICEFVDEQKEDNQS